MKKNYYDCSVKVINRKPEPKPKIQTKTKFIETKQFHFSRLIFVFLKNLCSTGIDLNVDQDINHFISIEFMTRLFFKNKKRKKSIY